MKHTFDEAHVRKLLQHSIESKKHRPLYGTPTGPGLILVGDQGVYLMSTGEPQLPRENDAHVAYADQVNPKTLEFDEWWTNKRAGFGGDDGIEYLEQDFIEGALKNAKRGKITLDIQEGRIIA